MKKNMRITMKASDILIAKIKEFEGYRQKAYRCPAGVWTCGYGHTTGVTAKTSCTQAQADAWLRQDLDPLEKRLNGIKEIDSQGKLDACLDFCFNLGLGNFLRSTLLKMIKAGMGEKLIKAEFMRWVYAGGRKLDGLVKRREWEAERFFQ
jgi:lysozyme